MRVTIVLPGVQRFPVGGYKVAYQFANGLAHRQHRVTVVHPFGARSNNAEFWRSSALHALRRPAALARLVPWFHFESGVDVRLVPWLAGRWLPSADATLLTAWQTSAVDLDPRHGAVAQLVYDYEFWLTGGQRQRAAMARSFARSDVTHIATSSAVSGMLEECGVTTEAVVNAGLDLDTFRLTTSPEVRTNTVLFPLRDEPHKGTADAFKVAEAVRAQVPGAHFACFGVSRHIHVPEDVESLGRISTQELVRWYNHCAVFLLPSRAEGWGLPAAEAMACGAAVVCCANGGSEDFAVDGDTALVVPVGDVDRMASAVADLLQSADRRASMAARGHRRAQLMSWEKATDALEAVLVRSIGHRATGK